MPENSDPPGTLLYSQTVKPLTDPFLSSSTTVETLAESIVAANIHYSQSSSDECVWLENFSVLACQYFKHNIHLLNRSSVRTVNSAVSILSNFLLGRIKDALVQPTTSRDWINKLTWGIAVLIGGEDLEPGLQVDLFKSLEENTPSFLKHEEPQTPDSEYARTPDSPGFVSEMNRPLTDLTSSLLEDILEPNSGETSFTNLQENWVTILRKAGACSVLVDAIYSLPLLEQYIHRWQDTILEGARPLPLAPGQGAQVCADLLALEAEIELTSRILQLPLYLNTDFTRFQKVSGATLGCVLAALTASAALSAVTDPKPAWETSAKQIVELSLTLANNMLMVTGKSSRLGAASAANLGTSLAWLILTGIHAGFEKDNENFFCSSTVSFTNFSLDLLSHLILDLKDEDCSVSKVEPANFNLGSSFSSLQRIVLIYSSVPVYALLLRISKASYRKSRMLMNLQKPEIEQALGSDKNSYLTSESQTEEEPILGQWMQDILKPAPGSRSSTPQEHDDQAVETSVEEPNLYLLLSSQILAWLSDQMKKGDEGGWMNEYVLSSANPEFIEITGSFIQEADKDSVSKHHFNSWAEFSSSLFLFTHNLVSIIGPNLELSTQLLSLLGLDPSLPNSEPWLLDVPARSLSILAQILLIRQKLEVDPYSVKVTNQFMLMWERVINSIVAAANDTNSNTDVNVENLQLMLLLFHSLQLMQKKHVLLYACKSLLSICTGKPDKPTLLYYMMLARMCLLVDYIIRHLYEPPASLLPQVKSNLFNKTSFTSHPAHFPMTTMEDCGEKPHYYLLSPTIYTTSMEVPKLDGLAVSFLLGSPETLDYAGLYESLVDRIDIVKSGAGEGLGKGTNYCFNILWRLLQSLPPPAPFLARLETLAGIKEPDQTLSYGFILHALIIGPRSANKNFSTWVKEGLVKQGLLLGNAESLLKSVSAEVNSITFQVSLLQSFLLGMEARMNQKSTPELADLLILDALIAGFQISLDRIFSLSKFSAQTDTPLDTKQKREDWVVGNLPQSVECAQQLVPSIARLVNLFNQAARNIVLDRFKQIQEKNKSDLDISSSATLLHSICIIGSRCQATDNLAMHITTSLPAALRTALDEWSSTSIASFPPPNGWKSQYDKDPIPGESFIFSTILSHTQLLNLDSATPRSSLKHVLSSAARFACDLFVWCPDSGPQRNRLVSALFPLLLDSTTEFLADLLSLSLERYVGTGESESSLTSVYELVLQHGYSILVDRNQNQLLKAGQSIPQEIIQYMERMLDKPVGRKSICAFFNPAQLPVPKLTEVLLSLASPDLSPAYASRVLRFFNKLFQMAERYKDESGLVELCQQVSGLLQVPSSRLMDWLRYLVVGMFQGDVETEVEVDVDALFQGEEVKLDNVQENRMMLQNLTNHIVKSDSGVDEDVPLTILSLLIPLASDILSSPSGPAVGFPDLMAVLTGLASAGNGKGHVILFSAVADWLEVVKKYLVQKNVVEKLEAGNSSGRHMIMLENATTLLQYISSVVSALKYGSVRWGLPAVERSSSPLQSDLNDDMSWTDEIPGEDEDSGDESEEDTLDGKLCTYTQTARVFMNQHWYHCHTCGLVDRAGCCSVCARVCHRDHDVTYSKHGSFFCDCGAREDGNCKAVAPRVAQSEDTKRKLVYSGTESFRLRSSSPQKEMVETKDKLTGVELELARHVDSYKEQLMDILKGKNCIAALLEITEAFVPVLESSARSAAPLGAMTRIRAALDTLHHVTKTFEGNDQLVLPTLGSQEGAFENVKMNFSGEQGQAIRQLLNAHMIRRGIMCCLNSSGGKRQHLAVSHEKGKITVLQLSALLKQADSSQKKLTLTRLASAPIPFTVLSMVSNPINENFLAVCGLKDCRVLSFNANGGVSEQLVLQPQLEAANYIIKPVWLPGSQTQLAIITADYVKIYDLSSDVLSPAYYFLIPSGKIRDTTFIHTAEGEMYLLLMSSAGHIYFQLLCDESSARHGSFYVTNIMDVNHADVKDSNGSLCGGGVSVYFSHALQMLFFSYAAGKSFMAPITMDTEELLSVFLIQYKPTPSTGSKNNLPQPLCGWNEVSGHPGLVTAVLQQTGNPVILMVEPEKCLMQEIKMGTKAKIMDMVSIRHLSTNTTSSMAGEEKTTLILLCEDGSLKIYMANADATGYWLQPQFQPTGSLAFTRPQKKKKASKLHRSSGLVHFNLDFFEHCQQQVADIEFGGLDILQVYNIQQVKVRLQNNNLYIANTKPGGFQMEISNNDSNSVIVAIRVLLGSQDTVRIPSTIEIFGRPLQVNLSRARWFELPLTREESIQCHGKLTVTFGPTMDPDGVNMIDSIQVWTKSKELFGWPEDNDEYSSGISAESGADIEKVSVHPLALTPVDKVVMSTLETLDSALSVCDAKVLSETQFGVALSVSTKLLVAPGPALVQKATKSVLTALHPNKVSCYLHTDAALLKHATAMLASTSDLDCEKFHHLVAIARNIAVSRPKNLVKFAETHDETNQGSKKSESKQTKSQECQQFMNLLIEAFWRLLKEIPANSLTEVLGQPGLTHVESTVQALVEILHAFSLVDLDTSGFTSDHYINFLLCEDKRVSFPARGAIVRAVRPRPKKRKLVEISPAKESSSKPSSAPAPSQSRQQAGSRYQPLHENNRYDDEQEAELNQGPGGIHLGGVAGNLRELLPIRGNLPDMLDLPADEAMVELAIALSLQDQDGGGGNQLSQGLQGLQQLANLGEGLAGILGGHDNESDGEDVVEVDEEDEEAPHAADEAAQFSDTTASAPGSDDEGSIGGEEQEGRERENAGGTGGSDSGGSLADMTSVGNLSTDNYRYDTEGEREKGNCEPQVEDAEETDRESRLAGLRQMLIEKLVSSLKSLKEVGGTRCVPYMQLALALSTDLDLENDREHAALKSLIQALLNEMDMGSTLSTDPSSRNAKKEFQLLILRLFSVLMSRTRSSGSPGKDEETNSVSNYVGSALAQAGLHTHCLSILKNLLPYWQGLPIDDTGVLAGCELLKPLVVSTVPDMAPFFLKQYVKSHTNDIFESYAQLLTEMSLRIPYQLKKISDGESQPGPHFTNDWFYQLCELMMTPQAPFVKRQVRKLLLLISGSKEQYRHLRDMHTLETRIREIKVTVSKGGFNPLIGEDKIISLPYDTLIQLIEQLKTCVEVAESRTLNWQKFCMSDETVLPFIIKISFLVDNGVSPFLLQLLQAALCPQPKDKNRSKSSSPVKSMRKDKMRSEEPDIDGELCSADENLCIALSQQVMSSIHPSGSTFPVSSSLSRFIEKFLMECNTTAVRWQAHALLVSLQSYSTPGDRTRILEVLWQLWSKLANHGRRSAQFVDVLGYFSVQECREGAEELMSRYSLMAVAMLKKQNRILSSHSNSAIYTSLAQLVDFTGFYLESDPCLVCNNPEVPFSPIKLSNLKVDTKYTTSNQMIKLTGSHSISKITLRIGDLKRQKMVRTINIYYNNRSVQAVVELKNRVTVWHLAKKISLTAGQTDIKVEFPLPIVACNIMIEYSDFFENIQAAGETLQCPRCSASVPANPGVCTNCGENVYQCHKCRTINYDEKDPFLCNSCGFCKYAKFEYSLTARPCCAVDPIETDEDRTKALSSINNLLEKADKVYRQLIANKPELERLLLLVQDGESDDSPANTLSPVNKSIHQLSQKYCVECRNLFEELSKLIQRVMATRLELVAFDRSVRGGSHDTPATPQVERKLSSSIEGLEVGSSSSCYGCAAACVEHCLTLLKALATKQLTRSQLHNQGLVSELLNLNLRRGSSSTRSSVQGLICLLTKDNQEATDQLNSLLYDKINTALSGSDQALGSIRQEMILLSAVVKQMDSCWESRLRTLIKLFIQAARQGNSPTVLESITLPCLNIIQDILQSYKVPLSPRKKEKSASPELEVQKHAPIDIQGWLNGELGFKDWQEQDQVLEEQTTDKRIIQKYFTRWRESAVNKTWNRTQPRLQDRTYLKQILFNRSCRGAREVTANLILKFMESGPPDRKRDMVDTLTSFLSEVGRSGEASQEFINLYRKVVENGDWHYYLAIKGVLQVLAKLIETEINYFGFLEQTRLSSDLALGYAVKELTSLLSSLLQHSRIKTYYKSKLVSAVLGGYLSLRRLVIQRTKMIDETQDSLLELLEDLTSGTEEETRAFMKCCVETVQRYPPDDHLTPVFIFERLCSIIFPEEAHTGEFYMILEKDSQQEEFLQGRMLGNPYSSKEPGLGPLMREVKNKICMDCELVALLEDDNGMELLVNNKIISLDLPVQEVFNKIWLPEMGEGIPMRIIYRMRGLLGDATEEFIESLDKKEGETSDDEEIYKLAEVLGECGGLKVMLDKLSSIHSLSSKTLMAVILKLLGYCCKLQSNRQKLLSPDLRTTTTMLRSLQLCLSAGEGQTVVAAGQPSLTETILELMEKLLVEAATSLKFVVDYQGFASSTEAEITTLLDHAVHMKPGTDLHHRLMRVLPFLTYANPDNMKLVINHFTEVLNFNRFDEGHTSEDEARLEAWVALCDGIERSELGNTMKNEILSLGILARCTDYIKENAPPSKDILLKTDSPAWKEFSMKPSIKFILRALVGLASGHSQTQEALAETVIGELHLLEQMSSDEHLGSLAEAVLEAVRDHQEVGVKVDEVRKATKEEKKKLAMAMRAKQLKSIGLKTNEKGQVKAEQSLLQQFQGIGEESGLACVICREGYRFQPSKVLAIYTFTRRCSLEDAEKGGRKTMGFSTVSHFNLVHVDCHLAAVRQARGREEWESALLQNANTKCNGLLPLWGPGVTESAYAACLARHNTYLTEATGQRDIGYQSTIQDLKLLLIKFAQEKSFSVDSGGGGPQSNLHLLPYLVHMALYTINSSRASGRETRQLEAWLDAPPTLWHSQSFNVDGPFYQTILALLLLSPSTWSARRAQILQRLLLTAQVRAAEQNTSVNLVEVAEYTVYRQTVLFFAITDLIIREMFTGIQENQGQEWCVTLADWIRNSDEIILSRSTSILQTFQQDLIPAQDMSEVLDVCGLLTEIPSAPSSILEVLSLLPPTS